jgi:hypothetical protein
MPKTQSAGKVGDSPTSSKHVEEDEYRGDRTRDQQRRQEEGFVMPDHGLKTIPKAVESGTGCCPGQQ